MNVFEGMTKTLMKDITGQEFGDFPRMTFADAMRNTETTNRISVSEWNSWN
jgi:aspartyl-tRNA synthetase